jgi:hypothetical protein
MRRLILFSILVMLVFCPKVPAQVRSPDIQAFLEDARALTDETGRLRQSVKDNLTETKHWEPTGKHKELWTAVDRLASGASVCERQVDQGTDVAPIDEAILKVFIRMGQLNDTSQSIPLDSVSKQRLISTKEIVGRMEKKYIARKQFVPGWELGAGKTPETDTKVIARMSAAARRFLVNEYGFQPEVPQILSVSRLGNYNIVEAQARDKVFKIAIITSQGLVVLERHFTKH